MQTQQLKPTVIFYGATRFEAPQAGYTFRLPKVQKVFSVVRVRSEFTGNDLQRFAPKSWKFIAECREVPENELKSYGQQFAA